ncbi:leucine-rich repeat and immunoglobulin-like domain-containing nogo receptor-interacting protein 3 [Coccinella septempunctata]|uniref:leucine-rich repeat and immunoglobulin-like domain-containing nogo receptor-interacting protein 3 n=1 Tax=Coccinella septempunctata TaxID=41139 RepID=UPI001D08D694|nr:leucine-rich repeat and immunoglobulin-like domain-containing nogo receptor-interacting protein 3 [Coccinella septempunctata]
MIFIAMFSLTLNLLLLFLPPILCQPIEETVLLKSVVISNHSGPLNEHSLGTYFDRVGDLKIKNSNISDLSKGTLKLLSQLQNLTISDSSIQKTEDDVFSSCCPTLRVLRVTNWKDMEEEDLRGIGTLPLETLSIDHQNLTQLGEDIFRNTNLKCLSLDHNNIKYLSNAVFDDLYQLEELSISWNDLDELPRDVLAPLKRLKTLKLETDRFSKFSWVNLTYLPELTEIYLTKKQMVEVNLWGIQEKAPKLKDVYLVGNDGIVTDENEGPTIHF